MTDRQKEILLTTLIQQEGAAAVRVERFGKIMNWGRTKAWQRVKDRTVRCVKDDGRTTVPLTEVVRLLDEGMSGGPERAA